MDIGSWAEALTPLQRAAFMVSSVSCLIGFLTFIAKLIRLYPKKVSDGRWIYIAELTEMAGAFTVAFFGATGLVYIAKGIVIDLRDAFVLIALYLLVMTVFSTIYIRSAERREGETSSKDLSSGDTDGAEPSKGLNSGVVEGAEESN